MKTKNLFTRLGVASREAWVLPALIAILNLLPAGRVTAQTFTTLHSFNGSDGGYPRAGLILSGNILYGTASEGGTSGAGKVFAVNTDGTGFTNLHSFQLIPYAMRPSVACANIGDCAAAGCDNSQCIPVSRGLYECECYGFGDGAYPFAGLILSGDTLYGTASQGGTARNDYQEHLGTVFSVNTNGTGFTTLHSFFHGFGGGSDGRVPLAGLILSGNTLYGTTLEGGNVDNGTVFAVHTDGTGFTNLHSFNGSDGGYPRAGLILSGNILYGTANNGGSAYAGTVFAVNTDGTGFTNLHIFTGGNDGAHPEAGLILSGNILYGTAVGGGSSSRGTVFAVKTDGTGFTNLHSFTGSDGANPSVGLITNSSGNTLYGTAFLGGSSGKGTVFAVNTDGTGFTNLHTFAGYPNDGAGPQASLILSANTLYGTASSVDSLGAGTVFSLSFRPQLTIIPSGVPPSGIILTWPTNVAGFDYTGYTLQSASALTGTFTNLPAATSPYTNPITGPQQFFRLSQ